MQLIARRIFSYAKRTVRKGEHFDAPDEHARLLLFARSADAVSLDRLESPPEPIVEAARPKRQYRRKTANTEATEEAPKRRYRRKDMQATE